MPAADEIATSQSLERSVLSGCLASPDGLDDATETLVEADFTSHVHRLIFRACLDLRRSGVTASAATVLTALVAAGQKAELGADPAAFFADLAELDPTGANARYYARLLRGTAVKLGLRRGLVVLERDLDGGMPADELLAAAERTVFDLGDRMISGSTGPQAAKDFMFDALQRIDERKAAGGRLAGLATGFFDLDEYLAGLRTGELTILAARPSVGKSAFAQTIAVNVADAGTPVLFFSLEMPSRQLADRLLSMRSGVAMHRFTRGTALDRREVEAVTAAGESARALPLFIEDATNRTAGQIAAITRRLIRRHAVGLVVVDYLQLIEPENPRENRNAQVGLIARRLLQLARDCSIPVIALAQLNREVENRQGQRPRLADLRDSGELEQHANAVVFLHRPPDQPADAPVWAVEATIAKNRNGPVGEVPLAFRRAVVRFENALPEAV